MKIFNTLILLCFIATQAGARAAPHAPADATIPKNQGSSGFCWSFALNGLMESEALKTTGRTIHLSPFYLGLYHLLFEIQDSMSYYKRVAHNLDAKSREDLAEKEATRIAEKRDFRLPGQGNDESVALTEVARSGTVPAEVFDFDVSQGDVGGLISKRLRAFILSNLLDEKNLAVYEKSMGGTINQPLFNDFVEAMHLTRGDKHLPLPTDTFEYGGKTYTPLTFMTEVTHFDPDGYVEIHPKASYETEALKLVQTLIGKNNVVPIGIPIYSDGAIDPKSGKPILDDGQAVNVQLEAQEIGRFDVDYCPEGGCKKLEGGHEVLAVNYEDTAIIIKNSWGRKMGVDIHGKKAPSGKEGYFAVSSDYLEASQARGSGFSWCFVAPKNDPDVREFLADHRNAAQ